MKKAYHISKAVCLAAYLIFMYQLYRMCWLGGLRRHLPVLAVSGVVSFICCVLWIFFRIRAREKKEVCKKGILFWMELLLFILGTAYFGGKIVYSAIPYHGALSWKIDELKRKKTVPLEHDNFFEDGAEGVLTDLDTAFGMPGELYISNSFQMTFDKDGKILTFSAFLYGKNEDGETDTYLVDYDSSKSAKFTVWLSGEAGADYNEDMKLAPMLNILEKANCEDMVSVMAESSGEDTFEILYYGKRSFSSAEGLVYLPGDADGDGEAKSGNYIDMLRAGGELKGYEVSLHVPGKDSEIIPVRYIMEPEYTSASELSKAQEEAQIEESKQSTSWSVDQSDGTMYFFLTEAVGWRLVVTDAAAGSRYYEMDKTEDGGSTWNRINPDPFGGNIGVTEGLVFYDENFGFAGLSGASQSYSRLYVTRDGGATFTEMQMPVDTVTELPPLAAELAFTAADYAYLCMPEMEGELLTVLALTGAGETEGILYQSQDQGETWVYAGTGQRESQDNS